MALVDLLDKIQSFDYNQVGKPQSFEAMVVLLQVNNLLIDH